MPWLLNLFSTNCPKNWQQNKIEEIPGATKLSGFWGFCLFVYLFIWGGFSCFVFFFFFLILLSTWLSQWIWVVRGFFSFIFFSNSFPLCSYNNFLKRLKKVCLKRNRTISKHMYVYKLAYICINLLILSLACKYAQHLVKSSVNSIYLKA